MRIILVLAAALAATSAAANATKPEQLEKDTWAAFKSNDVTRIRSLFAPDFVGLYPDGTHDLTKELESLKHVAIKQYRFVDFRSRTIGRDDVLLTYAADLDADVDGKPVSERLWMASLWHRYGTRWRCAYHTEMKGKPGA